MNRNYRKKKKKPKPKQYLSNLDFIFQLMKSIV